MPIVERRAFVAIVFSTSTRASGALGFSYILNASFCCERTAGCRSARRSVVRSAAASRVRPAHVASEWQPATQHHDDGPRAGRPSARRSIVWERAWGTWHTPRHTRRRWPSVSTSPDAHRRRRCFGWCRISSAACRLSTTSGLHERFARDYGPWRPVVGEVTDKFLACGILEHGFARIRCDACAHEYLLAFSCKGRYFCPRCHAKRLAIWAQWLDTTLLAPVPHRQVVLKSCSSGPRGVPAGPASSAREASTTRRVADRTTRDAGRRGQARAGGRQTDNRPHLHRTRAGGAA